MIIRNFKAAAQRKEKKRKRKEGQDTKKGPAHQPAHISFLVTYLFPQPSPSTSIRSPPPLPLFVRDSSLCPSLSCSSFALLLPATIPSYLLLSPSSLLVPPPEMHAVMYYLAICT
jgi:hypothetical protein